MANEKRLDGIENLLRQNGRVTVDNLCRIYHVTEATIRRDLTSLEARGKATRFHGGAFLPSSLTNGEKPLSVRSELNVKEKEAIAGYALRFISEGQKIFFDTGTTTLSLARQLNSELRITAVTDMLVTALELNTRANIQVILLGGELNKSSSSCSGYLASKALNDMYFDTVFMGIPYLTMDGALTTDALADVSLKQELLTRAHRVIFLSDSSKISAPNLFNYGHIGNGHTLITDSRFPDECRKAIEKRGGRVIRVEVPEK